MKRYLLAPLFLLLITTLSCGSKGSIEQVPTTEPAEPTSPTTQILLLPPKQFLGGKNLITGSGGGQTYNMAVGLNHYENSTMVNGSYRLIIGQPQQVVSP